jgi:hypothetical protein
LPVQTDDFQKIYGLFMTPHDLLLLVMMLTPGLLLSVAVMGMLALGG